MQLRDRRQGTRQPLNAREIHVGNLLMRDIPPRIALAPPREASGLYGRLLFSVKCFSYDGGLSNISSFFADHDEAEAGYGGCDEPS